MNMYGANVKITQMKLIFPPILKSTALAALQTISFVGQSEASCGVLDSLFYVFECSVF
jgi:hypothetical protein